MTIVRAELKPYKALVNTSDGTNGGHMSANVITSGALNNVFPDATEAQRTSGLTTYRKVFHKIANDDDDTLYDSFMYISKFTQGDDWITMFAGTNSQVQSDVSADGETDSETHYGCGKLNTNVASGSNYFDVWVENGGAMPTIFRVGDRVRITNKTDIDDVVGTEEILTIAAGGVSGPVGNVYTLTFEENLENSYQTANTYISSIMEIGDVVGAVSSLVVTTAGDGDYTGTIVVDSIGGVADDWTIDFQTSTSFTCTGSRTGVVDPGVVQSDFSPVNSDFSKPYFLLPSAGFSGTWAGGDTITFTTTPAAVPVWFKRRIPVGSAAQSNNEYRWVLDGQAG